MKSPFIKFLIFHSCLVMVFTGKCQQGPLVFENRVNGGTAGRVVVNNQIELIRGEIQNLRKISNVGIVYSYSNMAVSEFKTEKEYIADKREKFKEKKVDAFLEEWNRLPGELYEPNFEKFFNKYISKIGIHGSNSDNNSDVILHVDVIHIEPDAYRGDERLMPSVSLVCTFVSKSGDILAKFDLTAYGSVENNFGERLRECFAIGGKMLAKKIVKEIYD